MNARGRFVGLRKGFKNARLLRLRNATAGIRNGKVQVSLVVRASLDRDAKNHFPLRGKLDRVVGEIDRICRSRSGSPINWSGTSSEMSAIRAKPFWMARILSGLTTP